LGHLFETVGGYTGTMIGWGCAVWGTGGTTRRMSVGQYLPGLLPLLANSIDMGPGTTRTPTLRDKPESLRARMAESDTGQGTTPPRAPCSGAILRPLRCSWSSTGIQPTHRWFRSDAAGFGRLRKLARLPCSGRTLGKHSAGNEQGAKQRGSRARAKAGMVSPRAGWRRLCRQG
jgi:hypothetical protein